MAAEEFEAMKEEVQMLKEHVDDLLRALDIATQTVVRVAANQERFQEQFDKQLERLAEAQFRTDERLDRLAKSQEQTDETVKRLSITVDRLSETVDRYLDARLNGHSQN